MRQNTNAMRQYSLGAMALGLVLILAAAALAAAPSTKSDAKTGGKAAAKTAHVTGIKILEVGLFSSALEQRERAASVADGIKDRARDFTLLKRGTSVEAALDTGIGLRYELLGAPKDAQVLLDVMVRHPSMVNPDTQLPMTHSTVQFERAIGRVEHTLWNFDTLGGLLPGEYVIELLLHGKLLTRQVFHVTVKQP